MGRVEQELRGVQPIGMKVPNKNELKEKGPPPKQQADLDRLAREITPTTSPAERKRLSAEIFGASQAEIIKSEAIVWNVLTKQAQAKYPELNGKTGSEIGAFLDNIKATNPTEHAALMNLVAAETMKAYKAAGIDTKTLSVLWGESLASTTAGLESSAKGIASMNPEGMLATALIGGGTFLLTGSKGWALGLGGFTAIIQSDEATDFLTEKAMPAVGRTAVQGVTVLAKAATLPGHALNHIFNGEPQQIINDLGRFTNVDVNNALRVILGGEALPNGDTKILVEAMRELMAKDIAVAPAVLQPTLKIILTGTPAQKAALSKDQIEPAIDFFIKTRGENVDKVAYIKLIRKRFKGEDLNMEERQKLILAQSQSVIAGYLQSHPNFDYEALVRERFAALKAGNGGELPSLTLNQALPPSAALKSHDFKMPPQYMNNFLQTKGLSMPKYGTEWLMWAYMLSIMVAPIATAFTRKFVKGDPKKPDKTVKEPEIKKGQADKITKAIGSTKTKTFIGALVAAGIIHSAHRAEIEEKMGEDFSPKDFEELKTSLDTELKQESIRKLFYDDFAKKYDSAAIAESKQFENNRGEVGKIQNFWSNKKKEESVSASISLTGDKLPPELKSVTIAPFNRLRKLLSITNPFSYFRGLNGFRSKVTYLPILDKNDNTSLLKITENSNGTFSVSRSVKTWNPAKKVTSVAKESFNSPVVISQISFNGSKG